MPQTSFTIQKDLTYDEHPSCKVDLYLPDREDFDVLVYFHGGGFESGNKADMVEACSDMAKNGVAAISAEYRMYPDAKFPDFVVDGAKAVRWALTLFPSTEKKPRRFYIGGSSAGAYLAMLLCFDERYRLAQGWTHEEIDGYFFNAGQPTTHFNVLRERGIDIRKVVVDDAAPLYHVGAEPVPRLAFLLAEHDIPCRLEQTRLLWKTMEHFGHSSDTIHFEILEGFGHNQYDFLADESGWNILAGRILRFMESTGQASPETDTTHKEI